MNTRLARLIAKIDELPSESVILDCYNQSVVKDVAITITTRIDACSHYFILEKNMEQPKIIQKAGDRGTDNYSVHEDYANCIPANPMSDRGQLVVEPTDRVIQVLNIVPEEELKSWDNPQRGRTFSPEGISPCLTLATEGNIKIMESLSQLYRIRKLHPIETYRLQDVDEEYIDKLVNTKDEKGRPALSKGAHYNLSGDSITVNCLYLIFENLFYGDNTNPDPQMKLF